MAPYLTAGAAKARDRRLREFEDDQIVVELAVLEGIAERFRGVAFTPRDFTETFDLDDRTCDLVLPHTQVRSIATVTVAGVVQDPSSYRPRLTEGVLRRRNGWPTEAEIVVIGIRGYDAPAEVLLKASTEYVHSVLMSDDSGTPRDVIEQSFDGGITRYSSPNWDEGRPTGWLEVDRLLRSIEDERDALGIA